MTRHVLFYKPFQVMSQFSPTDDGKITLKDFIDVPEIYPIGRLDWDSEGLMLLSDDGILQHRLSDPQWGHPRTYWVQVERVPDDAAIAQLRQGVTIQNYRTRPAQVRLLTEEPDLPPRDPPIRFRKSVPTAWIELILTEGRNRQVRRMTAAVGFPTLRLVRVAIGSLTLAGLQPGQWRDLEPAEVAALRAIAQPGSSPRPKLGRSSRQSSGPR
jgi:23S rRNA pseudouridine2457 synthase